MFMTNELLIRENYLVRLSYEISSSHVWVSHVLREGLTRYILIFDNSIVGGWGDLNHGCLHWKHQEVPTNTQNFFFWGSKFGPKSQTISTYQIATIHFSNLMYN